MFDTSIPSPIDCRSGAVGDLIASRNAYGPYERPRSPVTDPETTKQLDVRDVFADLVDAWTSTLTASQRAAWLAYSLNRKLDRACPPERWRTAQGEFIHANLARVHAGMNQIDDAPASHVVPTLLPVTIAQSTTVNEALVHFDMADFADQDNAAILIYVSPALPVTRNFHRTPHEFIARIDGDSTTPPTTPAAITLPYSITDPANLNFRCQLVTPDGRVSKSSYNTYFWDTPPKPILAYTDSGPDIVIGFDKPLDPAVTGYVFNLFPRKAERTTTTVYRLNPGFTLYIDPTEPEYLRVIQSGTTVIASNPEVGYQHFNTPYIKHATLPLIVQPFTLDLPYP